MLEPDVTLTDYALALECALFTWLLLNRGARENPLRLWWSVFFAAVGVAALLGGTVHGFLPDQHSLAHLTLWKSTLLAIGVAALAGWATSAYIVLAHPYALWVAWAATFNFIGYLVVVVAIRHDFLVAICYYLPAALALLIALFIAWWRRRAPALLCGVVGMLLTFVAATVQQLGISLHPQYFNHNAFYHLLQAIALALLYVAARFLLVRRGA